jgi:hypothetical protein
MKFGTVINCIDGRVQLPVLEYLKTNFEIEYFDATNEAGPLKLLTEKSDECRMFILKEKLSISVEIHGSRFLAVVGHHDCARNPLPREEQLIQIEEAIRYLRKVYGEEITYVGLYVNDRWEVEEHTRIEP